ncbi:MAG: hypothetical protein H6657_26650 [Ardenticatenaceae bacterium]|nr:hypothetical protein [Ardenticatenaceae bacterium]
MNDVPETVLQECLDYMEQGESVDQIIARFPETGASLRPFLETAVQLAALAPQPSLAAKQKSQKAFLAHAESLKVTPVRPSTWYRLRQALLPLASLALVLILFSVAAVSVSASAIPGDALYRVKRLVENVRLNRTENPTAAAELLDAFGQERIREVQTLLRTGRSAEVSFDGMVEAIQPNEWIVADIRVTLDENTVLSSPMQMGDLVRVNGRTNNSILTATSIELLSSSSATPEPTPIPTAVPTSEPTATATLEPTLEPTEKPTVVPTAVPTATLTNTPEPTATLVPTLPPTATPSPVPTQPPPSNDNGDENENDNGGDDGNSNDDNDNANNDNGDEENSNNESGNSNGDNDGNSNDNENNNNGGGDKDDD